MYAPADEKSADTTKAVDPEQFSREDLATEVNVHLNTAKKLLTDDIGAFNKLVRDANIPAVVVKPPNP